MTPGTSVGAPGFQPQTAVDHRGLRPKLRSITAISNRKLCPDRSLPAWCSGRRARAQRLAQNKCEQRLQSLRPKLRLEIAVIDRSFGRPTAVCGWKSRCSIEVSVANRGGRPRFAAESPARRPGFPLLRAELSPQSSGRSGRKPRWRGRVADRKCGAKARPPRPNFRTEIAARTTIGPPTTLWGSPSYP